MDLMGIVGDAVRENMAKKKKKKRQDIESPGANQDLTDSDRTRTESRKTESNQEESPREVTEED